MKLNNSLRCLLMERHMKWLGHVCRMNDNQQPKRLLFGELVKARPFHGTKQHWRDVVNANSLNGWYKTEGAGSSGISQSRDSQHPV